MGKFFWTKIDHKSDAWQMPQGGIEFNENIRCCNRELEEETGMKQKNIIFISVKNGSIMICQKIWSPNFGVVNMTVKNKNGLQ